MKRSVTLVLCAGAVPLACFTPAVAQELPSEGKFSITWTLVNPTPSKTVSVGDQDVAVSSAIMTAVNDSGSGLLHNMAGRCNYITITNKIAKTFENHGFCSYADKAGDEVFEEFMTNGPTKLGQPVVNKGKWIGGTGKFEGLSGEFEIRPTPVLISETLVQISGTKIGTYRITRSPVAQK
jgi:hypothetical protein